MPSSLPSLIRAAVLLLLCLWTPFVRAQLVYFPLPHRISGPSGITVGPDGAMWFTETEGLAIGRIAIDGTITEFPIPVAPVGGIVAGQDGALWFPAHDVFNNRPRLGRLTTFGSYSEIVLPASAGPGIALGADGNFWLAEGGHIVRVTTTGIITEFSVPSGPAYLTPGPDGDIWFTTGVSVGKITLNGTVTEYPTTRSARFTGGRGLTAGIDGNVWAGESPDCGSHLPDTQLCGAIVRLTPSGELREFRAPDLGSVNDITNGSDGNLWFTQGFRICFSGVPGFAQCALSPSRLGRITPEGIVTQFEVSAGALPWGIVTGPDGNLWFTEISGGRIGRLRPSSGCLEDASSACLGSGRFRVQVAWKVADQGPRGLGTARALSDDAAAFWFFSANNLEVIVKVVDGRASNGRFWVFVGSLSDVEYEVTVTDSNGAVRRYSNPQGTLLSVADTSAF